MSSKIKYKWLPQFVYNYRRHMNVVNKKLFYLTLSVLFFNEEQPYRINVLEHTALLLQQWISLACTHVTFILPLHAQK